MAQLGIWKYEDLIGRVDLLEKAKAISNWKESGLDFSRLFYDPVVDESVHKRHCETQDHGLEKSIDNRLIAQSAIALENGERFPSFIRSKTPTAVSVRCSPVKSPDGLVMMGCLTTRSMSSCRVRPGNQSVLSCLTASRWIWSVKRMTMSEKACRVVASLSGHMPSSVASRIKT